MRRYRWCRVPTLRYPCCPSSHPTAGCSTRRDYCVTLNNVVDHHKKNDRNENRKIDTDATDARARQDRAQWSQYWFGNLRQDALGGGESALGVLYRNPAQERGNDQ